MYVQALKVRYGGLFVASGDKTSLSGGERKEVPVQIGSVEDDAVIG